MTDDETTTFTAQDKASAIVPKVAAFLSILGSVCILVEVLEDHRKGKGKAFLRLLVAMSIADLFFSFGWFLGTWPSPANVDHVPYALGNTGTCEAQGFIIQLGWVATPLFNLALSLFYVLVIRYNWSESTLCRLEPWVQGVTWVVSLTSAIIGLPLNLYNNAWEICWIESYPMECQDSRYGADSDCTRGNKAWIYALFAIFPSCLAIIYSIIFMLLIFLWVRKVERKTKMYSTYAPGSTGKNSSRQSGSEKIASQAKWYIGAYLLTFVPATIASLMYYISEKWYFWFDIFAYFLLPCQGFFNSLVFIRQRNLMQTRYGRAFRKALCCNMKLHRPSWLCSRSEIEKDYADWSVNHKSVVTEYENSVESLTSATSAPPQALSRLQSGRRDVVVQDLDENTNPCMIIAAQAAIQIKMQECDTIDDMFETYFNGLHGDEQSVRQM